MVLSSRLTFLHVPFVLFIYMLLLWNFRTTSGFILNQFKNHLNVVVFNTDWHAQKTKYSATICCWQNYISKRLQTTENECAHHNSLQSCYFGRVKWFDRHRCFSELTYLYIPCRHIHFLQVTHPIPPDACLAMILVSLVSYYNISYDFYYICWSYCFMYEITDLKINIILL